MRKRRMFFLAASIAAALAACNTNGGIPAGPMPVNVTPTYQPSSQPSPQGSHHAASHLHRGVRARLK
jgi:uncharacterized lipoprotein YbaY